MKMYNVLKDVESFVKEMLKQKPRTNSDKRFVLRNDTQKGLKALAEDINTTRQCDFDASSFEKVETMYLCNGVGAYIVKNNLNIKYPLLPEWHFIALDDYVQLQSYLIHNQPASTGVQNMMIKDDLVKTINPENQFFIVSIPIQSFLEFEL